MTGNGSSPVVILAKDSPSIHSVAVAATISIAVGQGGSVAVSGGGAGAENYITTSTTAEIAGSTVQNTSLIDMDSKSDAAIDSVVTTVAGRASRAEVRALVLRSE